MLNKENKIIPELDALIDALPDYAKDMRLNFSTLKSNPGGLTETQFWGTVVASSMASRNPLLIASVQEAAQPYLSEEAFADVKVAVTIMSMNNIYYRFTDLVEQESYRKMSAGLRMNAMREVRGSKLDFELWSLAVSVINACSMCVTAHETQVIKAGVTTETVQAVAKLAAVIHAIAVALEIK
jgi:alkyl hydroperoxide reductase subunit D